MMPFTDQELDLLNERVPLADRRRPAVDRMLSARKQRQDLDAMAQWYKTREISSSEKPLFLKSFWKSTGADVAGLSVEEAAQKMAGHTDVDDLYERAAGTLRMLRGDAGVDEFLTLGAANQRDVVKQDLELKRSREAGAMGFSTMGGSIANRDPVTDKEVDKATAQRQEEATMASPKLVFDALWPKMDDNARKAVLRSVLYKNPAKAMDAVEPLLNEMGPEQLSMFRSLATAARPEMEAGFTERYGATFGKVLSRRWENAKYFVRSAPYGAPLNIYRAAEEIMGEGGMRAHLENPTAESTRLFEKVREDIKTRLSPSGAMLAEGAGAYMPKRKEDVSDEDVLGLYDAGRQADKWEAQYNAVKNSVVERYKPLPSFQEYILQGHEISFDMSVLAAATFTGNAITPGLGTAAAMGTTWMDHQAEMERTLIYDHNMQASDAKLWSGFYAVPYAAVEYVQIKGFEKFMPQGLKPFRQMERTFPKLFAWYFPQYMKRAGAGTLHETGEEVVQAAFDFALMETARNFYETEGITFDGNAEAFWQETIGAVKYMWMAGFTGGGVTGTMRGIQNKFQGKSFLAGAAAPEVRATVRDRFLPQHEFEAEVGLRRAAHDAARLAEQSGFKDGVPDDVLDLVRQTDADEDADVDTLESILSENGYENPAAVIEMARSEIEIQNKTRDLMLARLNTLEERFEAESGQDEFVIPENGPKYGQVELALSANGWAQGLGLELVVVKDAAEFKEKTGQDAPNGAMAAIVNNQVYMIDSNVGSNAQAYREFRHEVLGHVGFDLSKNAGEIVAKISALLGLDYIRARLPQYAALHEAGKLTDAGLVEEFLAVMASDLRRAQLEEDERGVLDKARDWLVRSLGVESVAQMSARETVAAVREVMGAAFEAGTLNKLDKSQSNRAQDAKQRNAGKEATARRKASEQRIQNEINMDPVLTMVEQEGGIRMPKLKPGQSYPDEYAAIPRRFRATKRSGGLPLDEMADQAGMTDEELRAYLEKADEHFERILEDSTTESTETPSNQEQDLLRQLEAGEITEAEYDAAMNELVPRFSVAGRQLDLAAMPESMNEAVTATTLSWLKKSPGYKAAKENSDLESAFDVVEKHIEKLDFDAIRSSGAEMIVGVDSFENGGKNAIPYALKMRLSKRLNLPAADIAVREKAGSNTGASPAERMGADYQYDVDPAVKGNKVLLVDDTYTSGETVLMVAEAISQAGGEVVMVAALGYSQAGKGIKPTSEQTAKLLDILGVNAAQFEDEFGFKPTQFTGAQVRRLTDLNRAKDKSGHIRQFIGSLPAVQRQSARSYGAEGRTAQFSVALSGADLYREAEQNSLSDESGKGAAPADGNGIRRIFPGLSGENTISGRGPQRLGAVRGFERTEKIVDTGFTRIYIGNWSADSEKQSPIFETVTWNGVDAWVRQPMSSTQEAAHDIAGHAHNYFLWNKRNEQAQAHEGLFYKTELLPDEPKPRASDKRRAEARIEAFGDSDVRQAHQNELRFSVEQQSDPERSVAIVVADRLLRGEKMSAGRVKTLLEQTGARGSRAGEVLSRAKEIAAEANAKRSMGGNLAELIGRAEIDNHKARLLEEAHRMGSRDGQFRQQAEDEVSRYQQERKKYARQLAVALTSADLDDKDHIDISNLWKKLILEEKVRKPRRPGESEQEYAERVESDGLPSELEMDTAPDEYALDVKDWLWEVRRSVLRAMMKKGVPVPSAQKAWSDPVIKAAYMQTVENLLLQKSQELTYGIARDALQARIRRLAGRQQLKGFENEVSGILNAMFNVAVDQNRQGWIEQAWKILDKVKGPLKSRQSKFARQIAGRAELMFRDIRKIMALDAQAVDERMEKLHTKLSNARTVDEEQEVRDDLAVLDRFGGLEYKKVADIAEAVHWLHETMAEEMEKQQERVEQRKKAAKEWKATILDSLPKKQIRKDGVKGSVRDSLTSALSIKNRLRDLVRYGGKAAVEKAQAQVQQYVERITKASKNVNIERNRNREWLRAALGKVYGTDPASALQELKEKREEFAKYSDDGLAMNKGQLMQLVATFAQAEYAQAAQKVLAHQSTLNALAEEMGVDLAELKGTQAAKYTGMDITKELARRTELEVHEAAQMMVAAVEEGSRLGRQYQAAMKILEDGVLTDADMNLIKELRRFYTESRGPLSATLELITGLPIPGDMDPQYVPVRKQYARDTREKSGQQRLPVTPAGLSRRVSNFRSFDETADLLDLWASRMESNAQFKHFGRIHQDLGVLFNDPDILHRTEVVHGAKFKQGLIDHLQDIMAGRGAKEHTSGVLDAIVTAKAYGALGFNLSVGMRQLTSYPAFGYYLSFKNLAGYVADLKTKEGWETFKMILFSDEMKARRQTGNTQVLNDTLEKLDKLKGLRRYKELAMTFNRFGDAIPISIFGQGYYRALAEEARRAGQTDEAEIHEWAMTKVYEMANESQQSGEMMFRSEWQRRGGSAGRAFGMFTSTPQQFLGMQIDAFRELAAAKESTPERKEAARKHAARVVLINHFLLPLGYNGAKMAYDALLTLFGNLMGGDDEYVEDYDLANLLVSMLVGPFSGWYVAGAAIEESASRLIALGKRPYFSGGLTPADSILDDAGDAVSLGIGAATLDDELFSKNLHRLLKSYSAPYRDLSKVWKNVTQ